MARSRIWSWQNHDLLEIIIRLFCRRLIEAVRHGLPRRYVAEAADRAALKGRLDIHRQFTVLAATRRGLHAAMTNLAPISR